ncbi:PepSY domain-containing protein [uncultured Traorella sp.]|uniref:PepSY domain-containing protein n=1 Tax=uncultured Traorella sp. TaxID=1929048 RepID=UPI0025D62D45|nr:PepSY domain-containing protein [uncultured Traorella sp.]
MNNREVEKKIKKAYSHITAPDIIDSILSDCETQKGNVVMMEKKNRTPLFKGLALAAMALIIVVGIFGFNYYEMNYKAVSTIAFDVNPSIELKVNSQDRILEVIPLNDDAITVIGDMDLKGSDLDVAVNALIGSMIRNGYLSDLANSILISVENNDPEKAAQLQQLLSDEISQLITTNNFDGAVLSQSISENDQTLRNLASEYGITMGKAQLIQQILSMNPLYTFENLSKLTINELNLLINDQNVGNVTSTGSASDKNYIGNEKAKQIALQHANVSEANVSYCNVKLDYEMGAMVYEVEFYVNGTEYDYDINALSGDVMHVKTEQKTSPAQSDGQSNIPANSSYIGEAKAKQIALGNANVSESVLSYYWIEMDRDDGNIIYEIEFYAGNTEYEYEINALSGEIIKAERDQEENYPSYNTSNGSNNVSSDTSNHSSSSNNGNAQTSSGITADRAKEIALSHAGLTADQIRKYEVERDYENGIIVYEIDFKSGNYEYEYEINGTTGAIIQSKREFDD